MTVMIAVCEVSRLEDKELELVGYKCKTGLNTRPALMQERPYLLQDRAYCTEAYCKTEFKVMSQDRTYQKEELPVTLGENYASGSR